MSGALQAVYQNQRGFGTVPSAPTIGTATATGSTTANVSYTASASDGGVAITSYTAVSSPSGGTGTLSTSGSGTISVTGLSGGTTYTFTVYATNSVGNSAPSFSSNSITTVPTIGQSYAGGYYAGQISTAGNGVADYNLVIGPKSSAQSYLAYKTSNSATTGTNSLIDGPTNSGNMNNASHPAAQFCEGLTVGGYSDWYMPAKNELIVCYFNLKPTTNVNDTGSGKNANSVPTKTTFYTTGNPPQTSATVFQSGNTQAFNAANYWTSTQYSSFTQMAWMLEFTNGSEGLNYKVNELYVRATRRVAV